MTIAALQALIDEELPGIPRHPAPRLPCIRFSAKDTPMTTQPVPTARPPYSTDTTPASTTSGLIAWALGHNDRTIRRQGEQAHDALGWLRARHSADRELAEVDAEEKELEERLAAVRARRTKLNPKKARDYTAAEVRAWARSQGLPVPDKGQIPAEVLAAWRERNAPQGGTQ